MYDCAVVSAIACRLFDKFVNFCRTSATDFQFLVNKQSSQYVKRNALRHVAYFTIRRQQYNNIFTVVGFE